MRKYFDLELILSGFHLRFVCQDFYLQMSGFYLRNRILRNPDSFVRIFVYGRFDEYSAQILDLYQGKIFQNVWLRKK